MMRHHLVRAGVLIAFVAVLGCARAETSNERAADRSDVGRRDPNDLVQLGEQFASSSPQDLNHAAALFRRAADQGNAKGAFLLGQSYANGEGVPKDTAQAVLWYRKAAEQGDVYARGSLMTMFYFGELKPVEVSNAGPWWRALVQQAEEERQAYWRTFEAADQGDTDAMIQLGFDYLAGVGIPRNYLFAQAEFRQAAQHQRIEAQCLFDIVSSKDDQPGQTVQQCLDAASQGSAVSQLAVSYMYRDGRFGVHQSLQKMVYWESKAADLGMVEAENSLARDYESGYGATKDQKQADAWYEKAVQQGSFKAMGALSLEAWEAHNPLFAQFKFEDPLGDPELVKRYQELSTEHRGSFIARDLMLNLFAPSAPRRWGLL
ncbi:tetratricopeptide repeat protein [Paraburkholderia sediminicola]|uniref:tetratricopeptide repeat protein n=1 Tax=Paraburkholderia sediminicola TaxID=458836 RepID=UPI001583E787|nr:tetratricopeptide repeat protein [Paraburkholderia sediminicola]